MEFKYEIWIKIDDETKRTTAKVLHPGGSEQDFDEVHIEQSRDILPLYDSFGFGTVGFCSTGKENFTIRLGNPASPGRRRLL